MCYGRGSTRLAITDANFFLGRIVPEYFPFPLDYDAVKKVFSLSFIFTFYLSRDSL